MGAQMIETTYIRLERAAEMLGTDADTLLIAAAEGRIQLYGLLNQYRPLAEKFMYWNPEKEDFESLPVPVDPEQHFFDFVPLEPQSCAEALRVGATAEIHWLGFEDQDGKIKWCFDDERDAAFGVSGKPVNSTSIDRVNIFAKRETVESIRDRGSVPERGSIPAGPPPTKRENQADRVERCLKECEHRAEQQCLDFDRRCMPGQKAQFLDLLHAFDPNLRTINTVDSLDRYLTGRCRWPADASARTSAAPLYARLFPEAKIRTPGAPGAVSEPHPRV